MLTHTRIHTSTHQKQQQQQQRQQQQQQQHGLAHVRPTHVLAISWHRHSLCTRIISTIIAFIVKICIPNIDGVT